MIRAKVCGFNGISVVRKNTFVKIDKVEYHAAEILVVLMMLEGFTYKQQGPLRITDETLRRALIKRRVIVCTARTIYCGSAFKQFRESVDAALAIVKYKGTKNVATSPLLAPQ